MEFARRRIGTTPIEVTPIAMGCWPIAGVTSVGVTEADSLATLAEAYARGINFFDTAYIYGHAGESEKLIGRALKGVFDKIVIASKGGIHWDADKKQRRDARPETILRECDESLKRLGRDYIDLHYLHAPDPETPVEKSAEAFRRLLDSGKVRSVGVSNFDVAQMEAFQSVCPISAYQPHYNMLQREIEEAELPWCVKHNVSAMIYWPLMKGLLAGKMSRDFKFDPKDGRQKYPMFHGEEWDKNQDFIDKLRPIAREVGRTVAQVVLNWTIQRPGITVALCGAKRPDQIRDNAATMEWKLTPDQIARIDQAIAERGPSQSRRALT